jgi:hypothetical protein
MNFAKRSAIIWGDGEAGLSESLQATNQADHVCRFLDAEGLARSNGWSGDSTWHSAVLTLQGLKLMSRVPEMLKEPATVGQQLHAAIASPVTANIMRAVKLALGISDTATG